MGCQDDVSCQEIASQGIAKYKYLSRRAGDKAAALSRVFAGYHSGCSRTTYYCEILPGPVVSGTPEVTPGMCVLPPMIPRKNMFSYFDTTRIVRHLLLPRMARTHTHHERTRKTSSDSHSIYGPQKHSSTACSRPRGAATCAQMVASSALVPIGNKRKQADEILLSRPRVSVLCTYMTLVASGLFLLGQGGGTLGIVEVANLHLQSIVDLSARFT